MRQEQSKEVVKEDYCINGCPLDVAEETEVYPAILDIIFITAIITVIIITVIIITVISITVMIITVIIITDIITVIITVMIITIRFIAPSSTWWRLSGSPVGWVRFPKVEIVRCLRALIVIIMIKVMILIIVIQIRRWRLSDVSDYKWSSGEGGAELQRISPGEIMKIKVLNI